MAMIDSLTNGIKNQNEYSIAKSITLLENKSCELSIKLRKEIYKTSHKTYVIGITGAPGAGKSTLIASMVNQLGIKKIAVVSIDEVERHHLWKEFMERILNDESGSVKIEFP